MWLASAKLSYCVELWISYTRLNTISTFRTKSGRVKPTKKPYLTYWEIQKDLVIQRKGFKAEFEISDKFVNLGKGKFKNCWVCLFICAVNYCFWKLNLKKIIWLILICAILKLFYDYSHQVKWFKLCHICHCTKSLQAIRKQLNRFYYKIVAFLV